MREHAKIVEAFVPYSEESYSNVDLDRLMVLAFWKLEQKNIPLYFDHATVAAFKLFPKKFSMATFSEYPDTNRTNKAARRLTDPKRKKWATGNVENGFFLNDLGRETAQEVEKALLENKQPRKSLPTARSRGRSSDDEMQEIRSSDLFTQWQEGAKTNPHEFFAFLKAAPYTPRKMLLERLKQLQQSAVDARDPDAEKFLKWVDETFHDFIYTV